MTPRHRGKSILPLLAGLAMTIAATSRPACCQTRSESTSPDSPLGGAEAPDSPSVRRTVGASALSGPVDATTYRLGPGDVLSLEFAGRAFGSHILVLDSEGKVRAPSIGIVSLSGLTLAEGRTRLLKALKPYFPGATLDLRLIQPRTFRVYVLGEVEKPSLVQVIGSGRTMEAILLAGGVRPEGSSRNIALLRGQGENISADLERFRWTGDLEANPLLQDGDRIVVPRKASQISVYGAVSRPGTMEYRPMDSLSAAVRLAGDALPEARTDSVLIVRFRGPSTLDSLFVDFEAIRQGRATDVALQADDRIFLRSVPEWRRARQVVVRGEVQYQGVYAIDEGKSRISDLIRWAGGLTARASRKAILLERFSKPQGTDLEFERLSRLSRGEMTNSEYQTFRSKLALRQSAYLVDYSTGSPMPPAADVLLRDGDQIEVPRLELAVRVDGSVLRPGLVAYAGPRRVSEYIEMAGGTTRRANESDARLTRASTGTTQLARDVKLVEPGDFIWVPEKKDASFWGVVKDVFAVAGQVATIVILVDTLSK